MKLYIDNREPQSIIEILKVRITNYQLCNLDIGDYQILDDNDNIILIFERKFLN